MKPRERLLPYLAELDAPARIPGARAGLGTEGRVNLERSAQSSRLHLPVSAPLFPDGQLTDRGIQFRIAEMIREKLTLELNQELPYGIAVEVEKLAEEDGQLNVDAAIWVDREGQKPIVIGARGERLKRVGTSARLELNDMLGRRLHLTCG